MNVRKVKMNSSAKKGEILGVTVQVGTKHKNAKAPIFSDKYKKVNFGYFLVKEVDDKKRTMVIMNLETKEEKQIQHLGETPLALFQELFEEIKTKAELLDLNGYTTRKDYSIDENTFSSTVSIYPSFAITSLSNSVMQDDGTFTFSLNDIDGICLNQLARCKEKFMLRHYRRF